MSYLDLNDMIDGGGPGRSGPSFEGGGLLSLIANMIATPRGSRDRQPPTQPQGGLLSTQARPVPQTQPSGPAGGPIPAQYATAFDGGPMRTPAMPSGQDIMASLLRDPQHMQRVADAQRQERAGNAFDQFGQFNLGLPAQRHGQPIGAISDPSAPTGLIRGIAPSVNLAGSYTLVQDTNNDWAVYPDGRVLNADTGAELSSRDSLHEILVGQAATGAVGRPAIRQPPPAPMPSPDEMRRLQAYLGGY